MKLNSWRDLPDNWEDYTTNIGWYPDRQWQVYGYFGYILLYMPGDDIAIFTNIEDCHAYVEEVTQEPVEFMEG